MKDIHLTTVYYMRLDRAQFIFFFNLIQKILLSLNHTQLYVVCCVGREKPDEGPMLETLDYTIRIGSTPSICMLNYVIKEHSSYQVMPALNWTLKQSRVYKNLLCFFRAFPTSLFKSIFFFIFSDLLLL